MKIPLFIKRMNDGLNRYFPDRQMYFRSNGDVKFIKVSKNFQILTSSALVCFVVWCGVISYNYIYLGEILDNKNAEVAEANRNYEKLEVQFAELQNDIQKTAMALEHRQQYIQQVLEEEGEDLTPAAPFEADDSIIADQEYVDVDDTTNDQDARNTIRDEGLERIFVELKRLEMKQNQLVSSLNGKMDQRLTSFKETLTDAGIIHEEMLKLANLPLNAVGGPFLEVKGGINEQQLDSRSFDSLYNKRASIEDMVTAIKHLPIATPPEKHYVSSRFGIRRDPITKKWANHKGIDMAGWRNTPINAGGAGVVTRAGRNGAFGLYIEIDHGNGFKTKYGHLSKLKVKRGDEVDADQLIALMGSTGRSTSSHLHYEIWFNGNPIDPLKVIKAAKDVQKIKEQEYGI